MSLGIFDLGDAAQSHWVGPGTISERSHSDSVTIVFGDISLLWGILLNAACWERATLLLTACPGSRTCVCEYKCVRVGECLSGYECVSA